MRSFLGWPPPLLLFVIILIWFCGYWFGIIIESGYNFLWCVLFLSQIIRTYFFVCCKFVNHHKIILL
jgi:hypothetical protein